MLSIKKNSRFRAIYASADSKADRYLVMYHTENGGDFSRLGITVSGKIGNAVTRNRIRRRIREIVRLSEGSFLSGYDIVVVARKPSAEADYRVLERSVMKLASACGLLKEGV